MILSLTQVHKSLSLTQYTMNNPPYLVYISEIICGISLSGFFGGKDSVPTQWKINFVAIFVFL